MVSLIIEEGDVTASLQSAAYGVVNLHSNGTYDRTWVVHRYCVKCGIDRKIELPIHLGVHAHYCPQCLANWSKLFLALDDFDEPNISTAIVNRRKKLDEEIISSKVIERINDAANQGEPYNLHPRAEVYISFHPDVTKILASGYRDTYSNPRVIIQNYD